MFLHSFLPGCSARTPIGIDVGDDAIRLIQLDARTQKIRAAAALPRECDDLREDQEWRSRFKRVLRRSGFRGSTCVVGAPRSIINVHPIRMPEMPAKEIRESLAWEASERFDIPREHLHVDGIRTGARYSGNEGDRSEVVLFAMDERDAAPWLELLLDSGLAPLALEPGFCGVARTHSRRYRREQDRGRIHVVLDVGAVGSTLMYLRGDRIGFCKTIMVGGESFDQAISEGLGVDLASASAFRRDRRQDRRDDRSFDAAVESGTSDTIKPLLHELASEVALCLRHCSVSFRGSRPEQLVLTGRDAAEPGLAEILGEVTGVEVVREDCNGTMAMISEQLSELGCRDDEPAAWATAMGLALRNQRIRTKRVGRAA